MSERFTNLYSLPRNLYCEGSPLIISAGSLLKDSNSGKVLAQLKFKNISKQAVIAVKVRIYPLDASNLPLDEIVEYDYLDLNIARDCEFGQKMAVLLSSNSARAFKVDITKVYFSDNSTWESSTSTWEALPTPVVLEATYLDTELVKQHRIKYGDDCRFNVSETRGLWFCTCGAINSEDEQLCHCCKREYKELKSVDVGLLKAEASKRLEAEQKKLEADRLAAQKRKAKCAKYFKIIALILASLGALSGAIYLLLTLYIYPNRSYKQAQALVDSSEYMQAVEVYESLGDFKDSQARIPETKYLYMLALIDGHRFDEALSLAKDLNQYSDACETVQNARYEHAEALLLSGDYDAALKHFTALGDYSDSPQRINDVYYAEAEYLFSIGEYSTAAQAFESLGDFLDSKDRAYSCHYHNGLQLLESKQYVDALAELRNSNNYKDAAQLIETYHIKGAVAGDIVRFGSYEQDGDSSNGQELLEWIVLERDGYRLLLLSKYLIEEMQYSATQYDTWETSSVRMWLNNEFLQTAFSNDETLKLWRRGDSEDFVTLLSKDGVPLLENAKAYLPNSHTPQTWWLIDTSRVISSYGANYSSWIYGNPSSGRSDSRTRYNPYAVDETGDVTTLWSSKNPVAYVRPVICINCS